MRRIAKRAFGTLAFISGVLAAGATAAAPVRVNDAQFVAQPGRITFAEATVGTVNPAYTATQYGGVTGFGAPSVAFGGWFVGQSSCGQGCVVDPTAGSNPTAITMQLAANATAVQRIDDLIPPQAGFTPEQPVLMSVNAGGTGPVAMLFTDLSVFGVSFSMGDVGDIGVVQVTAYNRAGNRIGNWLNTNTRQNFFSILSDTAEIAGILVSYADFGDSFHIDSIRFACNPANVVAGACTAGSGGGGGNNGGNTGGGTGGTPGDGGGSNGGNGGGSVPEPGTLMLTAAALALLAARRRRA